MSEESRPDQASRSPLEGSEVVELSVYFRKDCGGRVVDFAREIGLELSEIDSQRRRAVVSGTAHAIENAFGISLMTEETAGGSFRTYEGSVTLPDYIIGVLGLDERPHARPHFRRKVAPSVSYTPPQVSECYGYPAGTSGAGQHAAVIELGGGYVEDDLEVYFAGLGLPVPTVTAVSIDGGTNAPTGDSSGPDAEVMLDLEVLGSVAPGVVIDAYFAPNTDRGFADALSQAIHASSPSYSAISVSWGGPEESYSAMERATFESVLADAAALGVTVFVAAGDSGSSDGVEGGLAHVDYPAASPWVTACGGTRLEMELGTIISETVWNDLPTGGATGGGISPDFPVPAWQVVAHPPPSANPPGNVYGRGIPDVAGNADPDTGYRVRVDGIDAVYGGTSAVAPLMAALVVRMTQAVGRPLGFANPFWYEEGPRGFREVVSGSNGAYSAGPGWNPCAGWGSPKGSQLLSALTSSATK